MNTTTLGLEHARGQCPIRIERGLLGRINQWPTTPAAAVLVVTDDNVAEHHLEPLLAALGQSRADALVLPAGETAKTSTTWLTILERLAAIGATRDATLIALGGGVIGDLVGFAAASYMRGINVIQAPTTLLAQVDAAVGGKTGFNLAAGKNLVGAFHQPAAVLVDVDTLTTLDAREYIAGLAEVIKYGAIRDADFLAWLAANAHALRARDPAIVEQAVARSIRHKIEVVEADEREAGGRALLNFGHTFAHALETETGYARFLHGEAVAIGMLLAARLSAGIGLLDASQSDQLTELIAGFGLPVAVPPELDRERLLAHMRLDKKNRAGTIRLILLEAAGRAVIRDDIDTDTLRDTLN
ncbi:MAG: 3-dehydroquinate synthase [Wenzhouxiangellaceae bacterium]|nr:3-dehydroquinate synthase [Wenzhouxiangellaceae bacterium]